VIAMMRRKRLAQIKGDFTEFSMQTCHLTLLLLICSSANDVAKVKSFNRSSEFKVSKNNYLSEVNRFVVFIRFKGGTMPFFLEGASLGYLKWV
jgi:hypothetical protein